MPCRPEGFALRLVTSTRRTASKSATMCGRPSHWPEYVIEATCLGLFMESGCRRSGPQAPDEEAGVPAPVSLDMHSHLIRTSSSSEAGFRWPPSRIRTTGLDTTPVRRRRQLLPVERCHESGADDREQDVRVRDHVLHRIESTRPRAIRNARNLPKRAESKF